VSRKDLFPVDLRDRRHRRLGGSSRFGIPLLRPKLPGHRAAGRSGRGTRAAARDESGLMKGLSFMNKHHAAVWGVVIVVLAIGLALLLTGQKSIMPAAPQVGCSECPNCAVPTLSDTCLKSCPRTMIVHKQGRHDVT